MTSHPAGHNTNRTIPDWNGLHQEVVTAESLDCSKSRLAPVNTNWKSPPPPGQHLIPPSPPQLPCLRSLSTTTMTQTFVTSSVATESSTKRCWPPYGRRRNYISLSIHFAVTHCTVMHTHATALWHFKLDPKVAYFCNFFSSFASEMG